MPARTERLPAAAPRPPRPQGRRDGGVYAGDAPDGGPLALFQKHIAKGIALPGTDS